MKKNKKKIIVGAGFSAAITNLYLNNSSKVISLLDDSILSEDKFVRRREIECNKLFAKKSYSYGTLKYVLKNSILHDRLTFSGNSSVWGGKIDIKSIDYKDREFFKKKNILFKKISYSNTGTISNNKNIYQLQNLKEKIFQITDLPIKVENGYVLNFYIKNNKIFLTIKNNKYNKLRTIRTDKLFLCVGSVQLIDLLFRSNYLKNGDIIEFTEFKHEFKLKSVYSNFQKNSVTVRYHISRAIGHYLGIQFYSYLLKIFKFVPLCIDQIFYYKEQKLKLKINNNSAIEIKSNNQSNKFGDSIHYCNLKINNIDINEFLFKINSNIFGVGMSFIKQKKPGPISNEIVLDAKKKCKKL